MRAQAEAVCAAEVERMRGRVEVEREEVVWGERARAERAEERARALERLLEARERVCVLEGVLEGERRRREELEGGLEVLALDGSRV